MVLSNKKLKQKLRSSLAESITDSVSSKPKSVDSSKSNRNPAPPQSLKELIVSAAHKPVLSKREKRRATRPSTDSESTKAASGVAKKAAANAEEGAKEGKKRKRDDDVGLNGEEVKKVEDGDRVKKSKNSKKNNNKKKKQKKKGKSKVEKTEAQDNADAQLADDEQLRLQETATGTVGNREENLEAATKVYVGGIPYYSTEDDIRSYFESCGTITEIFCMSFPDTGKFNGIAIISFKTEAAAKRALAFDGTDMGELFLKISPYKMRKGTKPSTGKPSDFSPQMLKDYNRVYIGNLSWDVTEDDIRNLFSDCSIKSIRFGTDKETGEFRGYAHVDFSDSLSLTLALKLDQQTVCGRPAKISCAVPPKTASKPDVGLKPGKQEDISAKPTIEQEYPSAEPTTGQEYTSAYPTTEQEDTSATNPAAQKKKKRRTCYECGERGHLSSECPKNQKQNQENA